MSEGDVSLIRDEDVLRRMWQQTEDFSRKKEIRAHMYRLREERLRNLYTPEPAGKIDGKGCEFTTSQGHLKSFADQSFQSMKSKEVRDAGSPPKEFTYRGQDLKELSNAGWNVESENQTTDDGHTHLKAVHANIEGHYDVEGGRGQFTAVDHHKQAITEYDDGNTSLRKNESASNTAAHEQVLRQTDDGTSFSSTTSSSTSTSKFQQVSSTKHEAVPYTSNENYDLSQQNYNNSNRNEDINIRRQTETHASNYDESLLKTEFEHGNLVSRKVEYPDDNTKVIIETRCLPDGTRVTSTRREFQAPVTQQHSHQTSSINKTSYSSKQQQLDKKESTSIASHQIKESHKSNIVDSQRNKDDVDFKSNLQKDFSTTDQKIVDDHDYQKSMFTKRSTTSQENEEKYDFKRKETQSDYSIESRELCDQKDHRRSNRYESNINDTREVLTTHDNQDVYHKLQETEISKNKNERIQNIATEKNIEAVERKTSKDQYQTTYQSDYTQRKISEDLSPSHQAWASTLRADTPSSTRPTTRASSPGTFRSSNSSLRSSVSPDKFSKKPPSRGCSPNKVDRFSPSRITSEKFTSSHSVSDTKTYRNTSPERRQHFIASPTRSSLSPDRKSINNQRERLSKSPEKKPQDNQYHHSQNYERKEIVKIASEIVSKEHSQTKLRKSSEKIQKTSENNQHSITTSDSCPHPRDDVSKRLSASPDRKPILNQPTETAKRSLEKSVSPDRKPSYTRPIIASKSNPTNDILSLPTKQSHSPDRTSPTKHVISQSSNRKSHEYDKTIEDENHKFINEETKLYSHMNKTENTERKSSPSPNKHYRTLDSLSPVRKSPTKDTTEVVHSKSPSPNRPSRKGSRSPSPPKGHVTFNQDRAIEKTCNVRDKTEIQSTVSSITNNIPEKVINFSKNPKFDDKTSSNKTTSRESSPTKFGTYDKKQMRFDEKKATTATITDTTKDTKIKMTKDESVKHYTESNQEQSFSPNKGPKTSKSSSKKPLRDNTSPINSSIKSDTKFKQNTDFIASERFAEETHKNKGIKEHPRQLITPSTSPTRKSYPEETEPSTGQSSPTTSVSGFVYFGSPRKEDTIITDLDEQDYYSGCKTSIKTEDTDIYSSLSSSKIPCRSPSPKKRESPSKDRLPRKSSLKKPSVEQDSPTEKPPSNFRVSPTVETVDYTENRIIEKQDHSDKTSPNATIKTKPPLERRETYEERCRKILGMVEDDNTASKVETVDTKSYLQESTSNFSSPSVSPCRTPKEESPIREGVFHQDLTDNKIKITDFLTQKQLNTITNTTGKAKIPSRETSPTKLQDIITHSETTTKHIENMEMTNEMKKNSFSSKPIRELSPEKNYKQKQPYQSNVDTDTTKPKNEFSRKHSPSPEKKSGIEKPSITKTASDNKESPKNTVNEKELIPSQSKKPVSSEKSTNNSKTSEYTKTYTSMNKIDTSSTTMNTDIIDDSIVDKGKQFLTKPLTSTLKKSNVPLKTTNIPDVPKNKTNLTEIPRHSRSPSPNKTVTETTEEILEFITTEREQEILNKVKKSLRKLSPSRNQESTNLDKNVEVYNAETFVTDKKTTVECLVEPTISRAQKNIHSTVVSELHDDKIKQQKTITKPTVRNLSPIKKTTITSSKPDKSPEISTTSKSRSISPRKPISPTEQSQSPSLSKTSSFKPKESVMSHLTRKTMQTPSSNKGEKNILSDIKKPVNIHKQNNITKISMAKTVTNKTISPRPSELEIKRAPTPKSTINKENINHRKDTDTKVTRTSSDTSIKPKKTSPQRVKSKPEIQINDLSPTKTTLNITATTKVKKTNISKDLPTKLANKPKSATSLNTSIENDDVIVDVQQAKSSRENSPDRICPTPVNFMEDVGTPRFPDEVSEPDDDFCKRTHQIIHETESIVDDIVEICEDDELFSKNKSEKKITNPDDYLLSVNDKVSKFTNKIDKTGKPNETTLQFKNIEIKTHSDFSTKGLKKDECLLSVSEKVNKFAKGPRDKEDNRSPSRRIEDEFDKDTVYQDDFTKLSVNDKAHLFVETAENIKCPKIKPIQKVERPDLTNVEESLKSDDCLLSVSDKVNKFVKTAEQFLNETQNIDEKEKKIKEQHDKIMKNIVETTDHEQQSSETSEKLENKIPDHQNNKTEPFSKETATSHSKVKDFSTCKVKSTEKTPTVKITTLRSSEAVKKAKALFENIATTQQTNETCKDTKSTKLMDIGVTKKSPKTDSTIVFHPSLEDGSPNLTDVDSESDTPIVVDSKISTRTTTHRPDPRLVDRPRESQSRFVTTIESPRISSPIEYIVECNTINKISNTRHTIEKRPESPKKTESDKLEKKDQVPGYQRPTKTSQLKEEIKTSEDTEVNSRRGSGKFGVELRRTSTERSTVSSERRRSSVEHHQPCIEDIFDLDLLEQMLEKVVGYEQRRRIRSQIRIVKKRIEDNETENQVVIKSNKQTRTVNISSRTPDRQTHTKSPERQQKSASNIKSSHLNTMYPDHQSKEQIKSVNGHKERHIVQSLEKFSQNSAPKARSPVRQQSVDKKTRTQSPTKPASSPIGKSKANRFNEYASAYMKRVGLKESDNISKTETKIKHSVGKEEIANKKINKQQEEITIENKVSSTTKKSVTERTVSNDTIDIVHMNGKRSSSPEKKHSPERKAHSPTDRLHQRTSSPDFKRPRETAKNEIVVKTVYETEKKIPSKVIQDEKPSWVTNRNLKKITSETRTFSSKKIESEKPKYRAPSPSKVISKPIDVITSSYGPGPLDADGKPLFGIKALRNGATNYQVKGTVIRQEFHSRNGGEPQGTVSVTAYSSEPEELERLLAVQGDRPSRLHGLAAITTTKKFGGDTGTTLKEAHTKEDQAFLEQFTHSDRKVIDSKIDKFTGNTGMDIRRENRIAHSRAIENRRDEKVVELKRGDKKPEEKLKNKSIEIREEKIGERGRKDNVRLQRTEEKTERRVEDRKTVRQSSVKSLTEKYIKSASDTSKSERSAYPKAGLILRTVSMKDNVSSDSSNHAGLARTDSEHSLASMDGNTVVTTTTTERVRGGQRTTTTTTRSQNQVQRTQDRSFLDSTTKVTGVQDILTRMKNADIVIEDGDTCEDTEARALLNKFLGATVLMAGMQNYVTEKPTGKVSVRQETVRTSSGGKQVSSQRIEEIDLDQCWDERVLRKLLDDCSDYEQRRRLRARLRTLMAEQEACASAVTEALAAAGGDERPADGDGTGGDERDEEEVAPVESSGRRDSTERVVDADGPTETSKVIESMSRPAPKPVSPFAKFRQLEKQNSTNTPNSPKTPQSPGSPSQPYFKFTDPALQLSALTIKERLLQWCRDKTRDYENVKLENFSTSWADGLAFCALLHHFLPDAFDYSKLTPDKRRHNFTLAFKLADEKAGIYPLLDVDDMVAMRKPDWKCVFTYVQSIHRRFKDQD